jgi:selenium-binding protein 1
VDSTISADDRLLWVNTFMDGTTHAFDISDPFHPTQVYEKRIGSQVNMVSQSWDGKRSYFISSLLANWDKKGADNEQYLKAYDWNGKELVEKFTVDFTKEQLGRAHVMRFGAAALYRLAAQPATPGSRLGMK